MGTDAEFPFSRESLRPRNAVAPAGLVILDESQCGFHLEITKAAPANNAGVS
jgi:hypothetical protein